MEVYSQQLSMQRICSILAVIAILCPFASPLWAGAATMPYGASCHRMPMEAAGTQAMGHEHHCHEMAEEQAAATEGTGTLVASAATSEKCPMNCCLQSAPPTAAPLPPASVLPLLHATEPHLHSGFVIFSSPGFSSHTDRGPPSIKA
jgi:hypothetical protein